MVFTAVHAVLRSLVLHIWLLHGHNCNRITIVHKLFALLCYWCLNTIVLPVNRGVSFTLFGSPQLQL